MAGEKFSREIMRMPDGSTPTKEDTVEMPSTPGQDQAEVYDPHGIKHRMPRLNAWDMVQHLGWVWQLPRHFGAAPEQKVIVLTSKKNAPPKDAPKEDMVETDLTQMDVDQLRTFAKEEFGMDFGDNVEKQAILDAIIAEQGAE